MAISRSRKTWTPTPSPSPTRSSASEKLIQTKRIRPSQVKPPPGLEPLIKLSPEDLADIVEWKDVDDEQLEDNVDESDADAERSHGRGIKVRHFRSELDDADLEEGSDPPALWEHLVDALLWTIPFTFLFVGMQVFVYHFCSLGDYAVHAQYGQDLPRSLIVSHLSSLLPTPPSLAAMYILNLISPTTITANHSTPSTTSAPTSLPTLPPRIQQPLLLLLCAATGIHLVHLTSTQSYLQVMASAPAFGTLWVWSVVKMDLGWAVVGLLLVGVGVGARGELARVKWWWN
ncbi:BZ3500_MvSof-1268-A1-R1_Chr2-1g04370 [Microbotryum saponariae]|uniref:BZ3500_MvSof-1268-A1-R1_Chr2-1g04370 protein n=1 Tax=Microbotryum saponariae TaxID=289078 RepID=A0A2X0KYX1_9BASI|nr:BZ3500_MvSof-1268-A1-R1_Chr2-1g04370 [Microbotryum saponariae]SCZ91571.1 BZ3501_MvSof-1269-A2-R1_Chr2-1g04026 [Microbotryum saponariae]